MIDSVAGAMVSAMPKAMSIMRHDDVGPVRAVDAEPVEQRHEPDGRRASSPARDHDLGAEALDELAR